MNIIFILSSVLLLLFASVLASFDNTAILSQIQTAEELTSKQKHDKKIEELKDLVSKKGGCDAAFCFAVHSSSRITEKTFELQKAFISSLGTIFSEADSTPVAVVQYGTVAHGVYPYGRVSSSFFRTVRKTSFSGDDDTSIGAPIVACDYQFSENSKKDGTIILFTDGVDNFGSDPKLNADVFKSGGGKIFPVGVGNVKQDILSEVLDLKEPASELSAYWNIRYIVAEIIYDVCS